MADGCSIARIGILCGSQTRSSRIFTGHEFLVLIEGDCFCMLQNAVLRDWDYDEWIDRPIQIHVFSLSLGFSPFRVDAQSTLFQSLLLSLLGECLHWQSDFPCPVFFQGCL